MSLTVTSSLFPAALLLGLLFLTIRPIWNRLRGPGSPYPPGPPERPLIGSWQHFSGKSACLTFTEWRSKYGDIVHFRTFTKHTVVLNSYEDCVELLCRRSAIYSDRPAFPIYDLMGWTNMLVSLYPYNERFKLHRRLLHHVLKPEAVDSYQEIQTRKVHDLASALLTNPQDFLSHCRTLPGAVIMKVVYGYDVSPQNDYFIDLAEQAIHRLSVGYPNAALLLETFPFLKGIPAWLPGAGFKRSALVTRDMAMKMRDVPFEVVQKNIREGQATSCAAVNLLEEYQYSEEHSEIPDICAVSYTGGADTAVSTLHTFFLAMTSFPHAQHKASREIDATVGSERFVTIADLPLLPYVVALLREVMRWRPVLPLSVTHATSADDVYKGYFIPKGTSVISNTWAIAHDPKRYSDPDEFNPDRFFNEDGTLNDDDVEYTFGFGRRLCPGKDFIVTTLRLAVAIVLQNFIIDKKRDQNGIENSVNAEYADGLIMHPLPFECSIKPRSNEVQQLILESSRNGE